MRSPDEHPADNSSDQSALVASARGKQENAPSEPLNDAFEEAGIQQGQNTADPPEDSLNPWQLPGVHPKRRHCVESLLQLWQPRLQRWAQQGLLIKAAGQALGLDHNEPPAQLTALVEQLSKEDISGLPAIRLLEQQSIPGAAGAYSASKQTIYLNSAWANTASNDSIIQVLTEEFGHHLDALIQTVDTPGDEGRHFAELLTGNNNTDGQNYHNQFKSQGQIELNGELIDVEYSTLNNSLEWIQVGDEINGVARTERAGWAVSLSEDGTILAVGSPYDDNGSDLQGNHGSVKIYQDVNGAWQQLGSEIKGTQIKGLRGHSVSLSNDGTRVAVVTKFGGHSYKFFKNCRFIEIKQGPYYGEKKDKIYI